MKSGSWVASGFREFAYVASFWATVITILVVTYPPGPIAENHVMTMGELVTPYVILATISAILAAVGWFSTERRFRTAIALRMTVSGAILVVGFSACAGIWATALYLGHRIPGFSYTAGFFFAGTGLLTFVETTLPSVILCNSILVWFRNSRGESGS